jgi:hypothetical protein
MAFQIRQAERKKAKLKLGISGPSGSGKTFSSLKLACGIAGGDWKKVTLIDTENGSGELYSHLGPYNVIPFEPDFSPARYIQAIQFAVKNGAEVIVIDSISHEWDGKGGCLDLQSKLGGKYQDWAKVTPMHQAFVNEILHCPVHVIVTTRKKQDYEMVSENGKAKVQKMGLKEIQRDGFEYELTINFDVDISHFAVASKDRTGLFMPRGPFQIAAETGKELLAWAEAGAPEVPPTDQGKPQDPVGTSTIQKAALSTQPPGSTPAKRLEASSTVSPADGFNAGKEFKDPEFMKKFDDYFVPIELNLSEKVSGKRLSDCNLEDVKLEINRIFETARARNAEIKNPALIEFLDMADEWVVVNL